MDPVEDGEELDYDPTAYDCLHRFQLDWPSLRYAPSLSSKPRPPTAAAEQVARGAASSTHQRKSVLSGDALLLTSSLVACRADIRVCPRWRGARARSFDIVKDDLGGPRSTFPLTLTLVAGTQAESARQNYIAFLKLANLGQGR